jgi:hypothetical protein
MDSVRVQLNGRAAGSADSEEASVLILATRHSTPFMNRKTRRSRLQNRAIIVGGVGPYEKCALGCLEPE